MRTLEIACFELFSSIPKIFKVYTSERWVWHHGHVTCMLIMWLWSWSCGANVVCVSASAVGLVTWEVGVVAWDVVMVTRPMLEMYVPYHVTACYGLAFV